MGVAQGSRHSRSRPKRACAHAHALTHVYMHACSSVSLAVREANTATTTSAITKPQKKSAHATSRPPR